MPSDVDKELHLLSGAIMPSSENPMDDIVLRLREIRDAKDELLTDSESQALRDLVIEQLIGPAHTPLLWSAILVAGCIVALGLILWGMWAANCGALTAGIMEGVVSGGLLWGLKSSYAAKRNMSSMQRLALVDRLLDEKLISEAEADNYRAQIGSHNDMDDDLLFPGLTEGDPIRRYVNCLLIHAAKTMHHPLRLVRNVELPRVYGCPPADVTFDDVRDRLAFISDRTHHIELSILKTVLAASMLSSIDHVNIHGPREGCMATIDLSNPDVVEIVVEPR